MVSSTIQYLKFSVRSLIFQVRHGSGSFENAKILSHPVLLGNGMKDSSIYYNDHLVVREYGEQNQTLLDSEFFKKWVGPQDYSFLYYSGLGTPYL